MNGGICPTVYTVYPEKHVFPENEGVFMLNAKHPLIVLALEREQLDFELWGMHCGS